MAEEIVNRPEESGVAEMVKHGSMFERTKYVQTRFLGLEQAPSYWMIVKLVFLRKPDAEPQKRNQMLQSHRTDVGNVEVICNKY